MLFFALSHYPVLWVLIGPIAVLCLVCQIDAWCQLIPRRSVVYARLEAREAGLAARGQLELVYR